MKAIDLFAGGGGFSTGARMAGVDVVWAPIVTQIYNEYREAGNAYMRQGVK